MSYTRQQHSQQTKIAQQLMPTYQVQVRTDGEPQVIRQATLDGGVAHNYDIGMMAEEQTATIDAQSGGHAADLDDGNNQDDSYENAVETEELTSKLSDDQQLNETNDTAASTSRVGANDPNDSAASADLSLQAGFQIKRDGKSNKYPLLKRYYEFGSWVGRNRKAICIRCKHTSASSQPERLIKHLRRCLALSEEEKAEAEELLMVADSYRKKRNDEADDADYYVDDDSAKGDRSTVSLPAKRIKLGHLDRKSNIDQALVRWIVCCRIQLKSIHSKEFGDFVRALEPDYRIPSREHITNVLIPRVLNIL